MKKYNPRFIPGMHYVKAHEAIASKEYGVQGMEDDGLIGGTGTIAQSQVKALIDQNLELTEADELGCRDFIMPYSQFEGLTNTYRQLKDEWIENNQIEIVAL